MRGKKDTFVLDFVNSAEDIRKAFEPYYEETVLEEKTDPNVVYDLKNTLDEYRVYQQMEIDRFAEIFYSSKEQSGGDLGKLQGTIRPALDRFETLEEEKQELFKSTLARFNRIYAFITHKEILRKTANDAMVRRATVRAQAMCNKHHYKE